MIDFRTGWKVTKCAGNEARLFKTRKKFLMNHYIYIPMSSKFLLLILLLASTVATYISSYFDTNNSKYFVFDTKSTKHSLEKRPIIGLFSGRITICSQFLSLY
jgi:hypothetical protein